MRLPLPAVSSKRRTVLVLAGTTAAAVLIVWALSRLPPGQVANLSDSLSQESPRRSPWIYGRADARFTIVEYTDLECPYCRTYFPLLQRLVTEHPEINWQWHHLPLSMHEPAATRAARLAECAGEAGGNAAFWNAVGWIYRNTRGSGEGLPADARLPGMSPAVERCMRSTRPDQVIKAQADAAAHEQITATPTLRLLDRKTGKNLTLQGLIEGDALLSAVDLLAAPLSGMVDTSEAADEPVAGSASGVLR